MPRGSKPGERRGGRKKGTPNKATAESRAVFAAMFGRLAPEAEGWVRAAAEKDPARGAELTLRMAEFHIPKLSRAEVTGEGGGALEVMRIERVIVDPAKP